LLHGGVAALNDLLAPVRQRGADARVDRDVPADPFGRQIEQRLAGRDRLPLLDVASGDSTELRSDYRASRRRQPCPSPFALFVSLSARR
jgi:hypothetical protein